MNKKSQTWLIGSFFIFLLSATIFLYVLYSINQKGFQFAESKRVIGEHSAKEASFNTVQQLLTTTKDDREKIDSFFIQENQTISFITEIERNATAIGVRLVTNELSINPSTVDPNGVKTPAVLIVGFDFSGSKYAVEQFLVLLENVPYHKKITSVSVAKSDDSLWKVNLKMQLTLQYD
jgi:hypothetical protein